ncbi:MAG TPA: Sjogren's syndrome/scleroderma autoantigen 1 family protein [Candidatus Nitrosopolaris sp.]|nr:Sjogren's syndrome/scleroderma autoantigen 1 family protein [Candidatus Nitrosopolaris sp.]
MPTSMVIRHNNKKNSDKLRDAASLLLKGGTLINDPCPWCTGIQVRFQNENICVNGCDPQDKATLTESTDNKANLDGDKNTSLAKSIIQEKIMLLIQQLRDENDISAQKSKADLIETYLRILDKTAALEDPDINVK